MSTLPDKLTCSNGHTFAVPDRAGSNEEFPCPDCGESVTPSADSAPVRQSKGRSLWAVMQGTGNDDAHTAEEESPEQSASDSAGEPLAEDLVGTDSRSTESREADAPKPKSLWSVVESAGDSASKATENSAGEESGTDTEEPAVKRAKPDASESDRPRGLWAMMGRQQTGELPSSSSTDSEASAKASEAAPDRERGWKVISEDDEGTSLEEVLEGDEDFEITKADGVASLTSDSLSNETAEEGESDEEELLDEDEHEEDGWEVEQYDENDEEAVTAPSLMDQSVGTPLPTGPAVNPGAKNAKLALGFGIAAFALAILNLLPGFWVKIPATAAGLGALVLGYQSFNESKRLPDRAKLQLICGSALAFGLLGMFSGPLYLTAIGENWREEQLRNAISGNLSQIGEAVEVFYEHHGAFPRATYRVDGEIDIPMHSWLSALLPHMGYEQLARQVDRNRPYDDPANFEAMSTIVPTFLVPNVDHQPTLRGLATSHFAGVGGETLTDAGRVDVGVFSRGVTLNREALSDGASQTMLAGEITKALPAWGEPGNWRTIGRGLNRQVSGFGNAAGTGAHFLMADGRVKFFSNSISRDVLIRLSTRNGGDPVSVPD